MDKAITRILDANINRFLEGVRVCEEVARFILSEKKLTFEFKNIRHNVIAAFKGLKINTRELHLSRDSTEDVGKASLRSELKRTNYQDIFYANIQRAKESVRVLEEFAKLRNKHISECFKAIRYALYKIEKKASSQF